MNKIITFIIPSYNVEHCLRVCLDSFLINEAAGLNQLEVIIVDDGSTDGTAGVAKEYETRYPAVYRLIRKKNGGHGSAINVGSREARGKYLKVVDADDWVVTENLAELLKRLEVCEADVVLTPFHMVNVNTGQRERRLIYAKDFSKLYTLDEIMSNWKDFDRCLTFHGIAYKNSFYQKYRHELPEKIFYEDQEYASIPCCHAETFQAFNIFLYQYLIGNSSQSVAAHNQLKRISHIEQVALRLAGYYEGHSDVSSAGQAYLIQKLRGVLLSYYTIACIVNPDKMNGRKLCCGLNTKIQDKCPAVYTSLKGKYRLYCLLGRLHISPQGYENLLHSRLYNWLRKNHQRENE